MYRTACTCLPVPVRLPTWGIWCPTCRSWTTWWCRCLPGTCGWGWGVGRAVGPPGCRAAGTWGSPSRPSALCQHTRRCSQDTHGGTHTRRCSHKKTHGSTAGVTGGRAGATGGTARRIHMAVQPGGYTHWYIHSYAHMAVQPWGHTAVQLGGHTQSYSQRTHTVVQPGHTRRYRQEDTQPEPQAVQPGHTRSYSQQDTHGSTARRIHSLGGTAGATGGTAWATYTRWYSTYLSIQIFSTCGTNTCRSLIMVCSGSFCFQACTYSKQTSYLNTAYT